MADSKKAGVLAAIAVLLVTIGAAVFVIKTYVWPSDSSQSSDSPTPQQAATPYSGPQIQVGIFLSQFTATGPHRQSTPYGFQTQLRPVKTLRDPAIHLIPIIEPNTFTNSGALARILSQNFPGEAPVDVTNARLMQKIDVLVITADANAGDAVTQAVWQRVHDGMGLMQRQFGYLTPGYNDKTSEINGFTDAVFGWNPSDVDCEVVGTHPLLGDLSGQIGKTITLTPNGTVGFLKGIPLLRVKDMRQIRLVAASHNVGTGQYLYPLYVTQLGKGKIVGIGYTQGKEVPQALEDANHGRFYIHCVQWLAGQALN
jgi:hypothetical protein